MGYHISPINSGEPSVYIGSLTLQNIASAGAFDSPISKKNEQLLNKAAHIMAIVEKRGIAYCLSVLETTSILGRDVQLFIKEVKEKYQHGFKVTY